VPGGRVRGHDDLRGPRHVPGPPAGAPLLLRPGGIPTLEVRGICLDRSRPPRTMTLLHLVYIEIAPEMCGERGERNEGGMHILKREKRVLSLRVLYCTKIRTHTAHPILGGQGVPVCVIRALVHMTGKMGVKWTGCSIPVRYVIRLLTISKCRRVQSGAQVQR